MPPSDLPPGDSTPGDPTPGDPAPGDPTPSGPVDGAPRETAIFDEPGASWRMVWLGPAICVIALVIELLTGPVVHWGALAIIAVVLALFSAVVVYASRLHVSVHLTPRELRQGDQTVPVDHIVEVIPPTDYEATGGRARLWESAPALGGLSGVPRKRTGIGVRLADGSVARAWARDHETLREKLTEVVASARGG